MNTHKELTLKEHQDVCLEILTDVHKFCVTNDIMYSLAYGTLIGAVRHKGFIPWDDDVDIVLPRPDYEKFLKTYSSFKYQLVCPRDSYIAFTRVCECHKTFSASSLPWSPLSTGVYIDIFPIDGISSAPDVFKQEIESLKKNYNQQFKYRAAYADFSSATTFKEKIKLCIKKTIYHGKIHEIIAKHQQLMCQYDFEKAAFWGQLSCPDICDEYHRKEDFSHTIPLSFEGETFYAMNGYDRVLREIYGDYMQLPPESQRVQHVTYTHFYWK